MRPRGYRQTTSSTHLVPTQFIHRSGNRSPHDSLPKDSRQRLRGRSFLRVSGDMESTMCISAVLFHFRNEQKIRYEVEYFDVTYPAVGWGADFSRAFSLTRHCH